jgi:hypothetical protein
MKYVLKEKQEGKFKARKEEKVMRAKYTFRQCIHHGKGQDSHNRENERSICNRRC